MALSPYEQGEGGRLQKRKADSLRKKTRNLLPPAARERLAAGQLRAVANGRSRLVWAVAQGLVRMSSR